MKLTETPRSIYTNREVSWLKFNERVLEEAEDSANPLLERLRFLTIYMSNLDEFYSVRAGMLSFKAASDEVVTDDKAGMTAHEQLREIWRATKTLIPRFENAYREITAGLEEAGVCRVCGKKELSPKDSAALKTLFRQDVLPQLSPFIIEKNQPFPFFENGSFVVGAVLKSAKGKLRYGFIPIPATLGRAVFLGENPARFMLIEDVALMFADKIFHKFEIVEKTVFSVVRNADIDESDGLYDHDDDIKDTVAKILTRRDILAPVKLDYRKRGGNKYPLLADYLAQVLYLRKKQIFAYDAPLDFRYLSSVEKHLDPKIRSRLCYPPHTPRSSVPESAVGNIFDEIYRRDILLCYPYHDMSAMLALLQESAADARVKTINITLYRVADKSELVAALIAAAESGKRVNCVVELRARFDEVNNIGLSAQLEKAGCNVIYGIPNYKIHAKILLIERDDGAKVCLVGTGNFNESTARLYTDLSLMTAHKGIVADAAQLFACVESDRFVEPGQCEHLLVAPLCMKPQLFALIDGEIAKAEAGQPCGITMKLNSLTQKDMIDKLAEASCAGVKVRLIVRGICCLIPGIPEQTENITVRSIVGRFLEHSRIFVFGAGNSKKYFISSADLMTRNLMNRVEAAVPVYDRECRAVLRQILALQSADNVKARELLPDGEYVKLAPGKRSQRKDSQAETAKIIDVP